MRLRTRAFCLAITALIVARAAVPSAAPSPFAGIVVFGTSMSDSGNAFALVGGTSTPPDYDLDPFLGTERALRARWPSLQQWPDVG